MSLISCGSPLPLCGLFLLSPGACRCGRAAAPREHALRLPVDDGPALPQPRRRCSVPRGCDRLRRRADLRASACAGGLGSAHDLVSASGSSSARGRGWSACRLSVDVRCISTAASCRGAGPTRSRSSQPTLRSSPRRTSVGICPRGGASTPCPSSESPRGPCSTSTIRGRRAPSRPSSTGAPRKCASSRVGSSGDPEWRKVFERGSVVVFRRSLQSSAGRSGDDRHVVVSVDGTSAGLSEEVLRVRRAVLVDDDDAVPVRD